MPVIYNETMADYHANDAVGSSELRAFLRSPQLFADGRAGIAGKKESAALSLGTLAHTYFLEPERFAAEVVQKPDGLDGRTKEGKAWNEASAGKLTISAADMRSLQIMRERMPSDISDVLSDPMGQSEVTYRAEIEGVLCQCRVDRQYANKSGDLAIIDLKTCQNVDDAAKSVWEYGYHIQQMFYQRVVHTETGKWPEFSFIFVETNAPYRWRWVTLSEALLQDAAAKIETALAGIVACRLSGDWSDKSPIHQHISAPKWAGIE